MGDPYSLDQSLDSDDADDGVTLCELLGSKDVEFDLSLDRLTLAGALETLPQREKSILHLRFYIGLSQRQIAELIQISQMHVSRLERSALKKLRLVLRRNPAATGRLERGPLSYGPPCRLPRSSAPTTRRNPGHLGSSKLYDGPCIRDPLRAAHLYLADEEIP